MQFSLYLPFSPFFTPSILTKKGKLVNILFILFVPFIDNFNGSDYNKITKNIPVILSEEGYLTPIVFFSQEVFSEV
jgi:hypothetical protein